MVIFNLEIKHLQRNSKLFRLIVYMLIICKIKFVIGNRTEIIGCIRIKNNEFRYLCILM
jgi:hypothetical protein